MIPERYQLQIRKLRIYAYHGVLPEEKVLGQEFLFDLDLWVSFSELLQEDQLENTLSYHEITNKVQEVVTAKKYNLLENKLNIYIVDGSGTKLSTNFSGKYVVIECEHIWDGENSRAHTKLIVGRKYISVANSYLMKGKLL